MTLGNYAKWVDVVMHIHVGSMGKSVNVKVVSQLAYLHIATGSPRKFLFFSYQTVHL